MLKKNLTQLSWLSILKSMNMRKNKKTFLPGKIRICREGLKLSGEDLVRELANRGMKISRQTLSSWENGDTFPTVKQLAEMVIYFGKPVAYFFDIKLNHAG